MLTQYHIEILLASLGSRFGPCAMAEIIQANLHQDRIAGQFGHNEYHFDNNAFNQSYAYMEEQRALVLSALQKKDALSAWQAFGRMTHTAQDFYAHSNYITMWLSRFDHGPRCEAEWDGQAPPPAPEVDPVDPDLLASPDLRSGKVYFPVELLYFFRATRELSLRMLPRDSHAWMNLDTPEQGIKFEYAMHAAIKKTFIEYEKTVSALSQESLQLFLTGG